MFIMFPPMNRIYQNTLQYSHSVWDALNEDGRDVLKSNVWSAAVVSGTLAAGAVLSAIPISVIRTGISVSLFALTRFGNNGHQEICLQCVAGMLLEHSPELAVRASLGFASSMAIGVVTAKMIKLTFFQQPQPELYIHQLPEDRIFINDAAAGG
jgi:hypothetical protein